MAGRAQTGTAQPHPGSPPTLGLAVLSTALAQVQQDLGSQTRGPEPSIVGQSQGRAWHGLGVSLARKTPDHLRAITVAQDPQMLGLADSGPWYI